jgi:soluble lytic murein transglycosylase-like protein
MGSKALTRGLLLGAFIIPMNYQTPAGSISKFENGKYKISELQGPPKEFTYFSQYSVQVTELFSKFRRYFWFNQSDLQGVERVFRSKLSYRYKKKAKELAKTLINVCKEIGVPPQMALALISVESSFRPTARSHMGAIGLMQLLPNTGRAWAKRSGVKWRGIRTLKDPESSIKIGLRYFAYLIKRFNGNVESALIAYNLGPTRLRRLQRQEKKIPKFYLNRIKLAERKFFEYPRGWKFTKDI